MEPYQFEVIYFSIVWLVSALAGVSRCIYNGDYKSVGNCVAVACVSGFLGFAVVSFVVGDPGQPDFDPVFYVGLAAIIGLSGKNQTELIEIVWRAIIAKFVTVDGQKK